MAVVLYPPWKSSTASLTHEPPQAAPWRVGWAGERAGGVQRRREAKLGAPGQ